MSVTIAITNANLFCSPYNTYSDGVGALQANNVHGSSTYAFWNTVGAYCKTVFSGTSVKLSVDVSVNSDIANATDYPTIAYSIDGAVYTRYQIQSSDTDITLATGLSASTHTLKIIFVGVHFSTLSAMDLGDAEWGTAPTLAIKWTGLKLDDGASVTAPTVYSRSLLVFGDSQTGAEEVIAATVTAAHQDTRLSVATLLADYFHCEVGIVAYSGTSYGPIAFIYDTIFGSHARSVSGKYSPVPQAVISLHGQNNGSDPGAVVASAIATIRALCDTTTPILVCCPPYLTWATEIAAGVTSAADANAHFLNHAEDLSATPAYVHGHLSITGQAHWAALLEPLALPYIPALPTVGIPRSRLQLCM